MPDFTVTKRGQDSSGRDLYATAYMWAWWDAVCRDLGFVPTITQGAFMTRSGGGADASAGYHDHAGTFDLRVWDLTDTQVFQVVRTLRANGAAAWLRSPQHGGFDDPHIHFVLGTDEPLSGGASYQWLAYINGGDGMGGRDYHPRPHPLVAAPPDSLMEDEMKPEDWTRLEQIIDARLDAFAATAGEKIKLTNPNGKGAKWSLNTTLKSIWTRAGN